MNDIQIKSILLNYYVDFENRCSFIMEDKYYQEFVKYNLDNFHFSKEEIFEPLKSYSIKLREIILEEYENNIDLKDFLKFLFYLDNKNFIEFLIFFMYVVFNSKTGYTINNLKLSQFFIKETKILADTLGL